ncbi:MAG: exodeoxyribonuclease VII large subunit [Planctomycetota bacterium]
MFEKQGDLFTGKRPDRPKPDETEAGPAKEPKIYTVTELTRRIKALLEGTFPLVWVSGEISNARQYNSGHIYLTLKDETAQLSAVIWRGVATRLKFKIEDGMAVVACGNIGVYEPRGNYQLVISHIEPKGIGALQLAFEQLKQKLGAEGLFDTERKRPLPAFPRTIGVVTSPDGAAIRDILNILNRRWPRFHLILRPVRVQGEGAAGEIAEGIADLNRLGDVDVMIVGRGGGSLEDLWAFNEEVVARAIFASEVPVISAVGHEIDFTISDFVADVRAATPSEAAELVAPVLDEIEGALDEYQARLVLALRARAEEMRHRLRAVEQSYALRQPMDMVRRFQQSADDLAQRLLMSADRFIEAQHDRLKGIAGKLESLSPLAVLNRGYSVTSLADAGAILRDAKQVSTGDRIKTRLSKGEFFSRVE